MQGQSYTKDNVFKSGLADLELGFGVACGQVQICSYIQKLYEFV